MKWEKRDILPETPGPSNAPPDVPDQPPESNINYGNTEYEPHNIMDDPVPAEGEAGGVEMGDTPSSMVDTTFDHITQPRIGEGPDQTPQSNAREMLRRRMGQRGGYSRGKSN